MLWSFYLKSNSTAVIVDIGLKTKNCLKLAQKQSITTEWMNCYLIF